MCARPVQPTDNGGQKPRRSAHEPGTFSTIEIEGDIVVKRGVPTFSLDEAEQRLQRLRDYARLLKQEPIASVDLLGSGLEPADGDQFRIRHEVNYVPGTSLARLHEEQPVLWEATIQNIIQSIGQMSTLAGEPDMLAIGIDTAARNWQVDTTTGRATLVDIYPPLVRDEDGFLSDGSSRANIVYYQRMCGTKSGAIAHLLLTTLPARQLTTEWASSVTEVAEAWQDAIPAGLYGDVLGAMELYVSEFVTPGLGDLAIQAANSQA